VVTEKPNDHDLTKLHAEINQLVNQRFLLTTLAVTVFGASAGWILQKNRSGEIDVGWFTYGASLLLLFVLAGLFLLHQRLLSQMRIFTTYLLVTKASPWEEHWEKYRQHCEGKTRIPMFREHEYTDAQRLVFLLLGFGVFLIPVVVKFGFGLRWNPWEGWVSAFSAVAVYLLCLVASYFREPDEKHLKSCWEEALQLKSQTAKEANQAGLPG